MREFKRIPLKGTIDSETLRALLSDFVVTYKVPVYGVAVNKALEEKARAAFAPGLPVVVWGGCLANEMMIQVTPDDKD